LARITELVFLFAITILFINFFIFRCSGKKDWLLPCTNDRVWICTPRFATWMMSLILHIQSVVKWIIIVQDTTFHKLDGTAWIRIS